jgi:hypothetical protein
MFQNIQDGIRLLRDVLKYHFFQAFSCGGANGIGSTNLVKILFSKTPAPLKRIAARTAARSMGSRFPETGFRHIPTAGPESGRCPGLIAAGKQPAYEKFAKELPSERDP